MVAGKGDAGYENRVRELAKRLEITNISFPGALYGDAKAEAYRNADLFVLPTHSENFGMAVAEALSYGCPAVVSREAPWSGLESHRCGWWVELTDEAFVHALDRAMGLPGDVLGEMGENGRRWMLSEFSWDRIAEAMAASYRWLLTGTNRPDVINVVRRR